ncbi:MAG: prepilin-type N-terminal cleavage/methylation domain-containing protein, partial [Salinibacterium sp.]|nr:prepilin-type N-terminal cleavage/methylation domain-containing protein [Salinibacterium sp.]
MLSLTKAFEARNERIRNDEKGFTLIELLVVVIIIGILAAIAIPVFLGQQDKAKDGATKSDLRNAKVFYVSELVDDPTGAAGIGDFVESDNSG